MELGEKIRIMRVIRKWSQRELGEKLGHHPSTVGAIERGERKLTVDDLQAIADVFGVDIKSFFTEQNAETLLERKV